MMPWDKRLKNMATQSTTTPRWVRVKLGSRWDIRMLRRSHPSTGQHFSDPALQV